MMIRSPSSSLSYVIFPPSVVVVAFIGPTSIIERLTSLCIDSLCYLFWCHHRTLYFPARFIEKPRVVRHEVQGNLFAAWSKRSFLASSMAPLSRESESESQSSGSSASASEKKVPFGLGTYRPSTYMNIEYCLLEGLTQEIGKMRMKNYRVWMRSSASCSCSSSSSSRQTSTQCPTIPHVH